MHVMSEQRQEWGWKTGDQFQCHLPNRIIVHDVLSRGGMGEIVTKLLQIGLHPQVETPQSSSKQALR